MPPPLVVAHATITWVISCLADGVLRGVTESILYQLLGSGCEQSGCELQDSCAKYGVLRTYLHDLPYGVEHRVVVRKYVRSRTHTVVSPSGQVIPTVMWTTDTILRVLQRMHRTVWKEAIFGIAGICCGTMGRYTISNTEYTRY